MISMPIRSLVFLRGKVARARGRSYCGGLELRRAKAGRHTSLSTASPGGSGIRDAVFIAGAALVLGRAIAEMLAQPLRYAVRPWLDERMDALLSVIAVPLVPQPDCSPR
jgi:hypothetical protein